jgi:hypothetical protein
LKKFLAKTLDYLHFTGLMIKQKNNHMIFLEILKHHEKRVEEAVEELFEKAENSQTHPRDILLILEHGFYKEFYEDYQTKEGKKFSPYVIGPDLVGIAQRTHYQYLNTYRRSHLIKDGFKEFGKKARTDDELKYAEYFSIQMEKNIYLRIWESDMFIKQLYQLSKLALGERYDWHFEINNQKRDGQSKQSLIRKEIRDKLETVCPKFYELLKNLYLTQIRNAIAHSQFYFLGRNITYLNYSDNPKAGCPLHGLSFYGWAHFIHKTLLLHSFLIKAFNKQRDKYHTETLSAGKVEVRVTKN